MPKSRPKASAARVKKNAKRGKVAASGTTKDEEWLPSFGRSPREKHSQLTDLGCPDCRGVLAVAPLRGGHLWFSCSIGHAFALDSLLRAKEEQLETSLWTAVEVYSEISAFYSELAARAKRTNYGKSARAYEARAARARKNFEVLRKMIAADGPPMGTRGDPC